MTLQAMWVHGNSVRPQKTDPTNLKDFGGVKWSALLGIPMGNGCTFRGLDNTSNWFHFSIPTPVIVDGSRAKLDKFFVLFKADNGVTLSAVNVWDGAKRIFTKDHLAIGGSHENDLQDNITKWSLDAPKNVLFGIEIAVLVSFADEGNITFVSAGADFEV